MNEATRPREIHRQQLLDELARTERWIQRRPHAVDQYVAATTVSDDVLDWIAEQLRPLRVAAVRDMHAQGYTSREIGEAIGVSHQRVYQLLSE